MPINSSSITCWLLFWFATMFGGREVIIAKAKLNTTTNRRALAFLREMFLAALVRIPIFSRSKFPMNAMLTIIST
jgi:hypothetical protein